MEKSKLFMVSFIALFTLALALTTVNASETNCRGSAFVCITDVEVNGIEFDHDNIGNVVANVVSETIPVLVRFTAVDDGDDVREAITDVKVKVYIEGFKDEIEDETPRFHILEGDTYIKRFTLKLPSSMDLDDLTEEEMALLVRITARGEDSVEIEIPLEVQRDFQSLSILSIDREDVVTAGDTLAVDVVVENNGFERLDDVYVRASIPSLGVSRKVYAGDLASQRDEFDDDVNDARERRIYLNIPRNAAPGNYEMEVEAYNFDTSTKETVRVVVRGVESKVLPPITSKTIAPGEETTFDLALVNPSNRMLVYRITPEQTKGFFVEVSEAYVSVPADSSKTVKVKVIASDSVEEGTHILTVNAVSDTEISETVNFTVNVKKAKEDKVVTDKVTKPLEVNTPLVITVILVIVFIVLLIILIVLLTRKPEKEEEFGETSYY